MKTYYFEDSEDFIKINSFLDTVTKEDEVQIYLNSCGGKVWMFQAISDRLNRMVDDGVDISIRCIWACSRAFRLFFDFKGKKYLEYDAEGIAHVDATPDLNVFYVDGEKRIRADDNLTIHRNKLYKKQNPFIYPFFTDEEKELYIQGRDIYLYPERMKEIFGNNQ